MENPFSEIKQFRKKMHKEKSNHILRYFYSLEKFESECNFFFVQRRALGNFQSRIRLKGTFDGGQQCEIIILRRTSPAKWLLKFLFLLFESRKEIKVTISVLTEKILNNFEFFFYFI